MNKKGFTLSELLISISLMIILFMGISSINFKSTNDRQRLEIFGNKIISQLETVRSNDLIGRGITQTGVLINPDSWKIELNSEDEGYIKIYYELSGSGILLDELIFENGYNIHSIICKPPTGFTTELNDTDIGEIIFEKGKYSIGGACPPNSSEVIINNIFNSASGSIIFNAISGLIKRD